MNDWLLCDALKDVMGLNARVDFSPTAEQYAEFEARDMSSGQRILTTNDGVGEIAIEGVLTRAPDIFARIFGGGNTTYGEIISATALAEADPSVNTITYRGNSGGGTIDGLFEAMQTMAGTTKPTEFIVDGLAASATYALATQTDKITATNPMATVGSVGIVQRARVAGGDVIDITSTNAPDKRPDAGTKEGKATIVAHLDAIHAEFVAPIAEGRGVTVATVNGTFGKGGVVLAKEALDRGMIDGILTNSDKTEPSNQGASAMDEAKLLAEHPLLHASILAKGRTDGVAQGITQEKARVSAHLKLGKSSGATELAAKHVTDGTELTAEVQADYLAAKMDSLDTNNRAGDDIDNNTDNNAGADGQSAESEENKVHAEMDNSAKGDF